jgi:hypothetical protein
LVATPSAIFLAESDLETKHLLLMPIIDSGLLVMKRFEDKKSFPIEECGTLSEQATRTSKTSLTGRGRAAICRPEHPSLESEED